MRLKFQVKIYIRSSNK